MWRSKESGKLYTDEQVREIMEELPKRVILLSGPTTCGKTRLVKNVRTEGKRIISAETMHDAVLYIAGSDNGDFVEGMMSAFSFHPLLCVEDADLIFSGREYTATAVESFIGEYIKAHTAVFTGLRFSDRAFTECRRNGTLIEFVYEA